MKSFVELFEILQLHKQYYEIVKQKNCYINKFKKNCSCEYMPQFIKKKYLN